MAAVKNADLKAQPGAPISDECWTPNEDFSIDMSKVPPAPDSPPRAIAPATWPGKRSTYLSINEKIARALAAVAPKAIIALTGRIRRILRTIRQLWTRYQATVMNPNIGFDAFVNRGADDPDKMLATVEPPNAPNSVTK